VLLHLPVTPGAGRTEVATKRSWASRSRKASGSSARGSRAREDATKTAAADGVVRHKVKPGETLYSIANSYKTTISAIKHNNRNIATLRPGMILVIRDVR
jgi:LysM repeat protein